MASEREVSSTEGGGSVSQEKRKAGFRGSPDSEVRVLSITGA